MLFSTTPFIFIVLSLLIFTQSTQFCNQAGCKQCYYRCQSCFGPLPDNCFNCRQNYIYFNGTCVACGSNCLSCNIIQSFSIQNGQNQCETCMDGFYLSQETGLCNECPLGAQTCTFSTIQSCMSGFYLSNSMCFFCSNNCYKCTSAYACTQCADRYYLNSLNLCALCALPNCKSCDSSGTCYQCVNGYFGNQCKQICQSNCNVCVEGICYECRSSYYMIDGNCEPISILCESGNKFGQCSSCVSDRAALQELQCIPYDNVHIFNNQRYITGLNNEAEFNQTPTTLQILGCNSFYFKISKAGIIVISLNIRPIYKLKIGFQIVLISNFTDNKTIKVSSTQLNQIFQQNIPNSYLYSCPTFDYTLANFQAIFTVHHDYNPFDQQTIDISFYSPNITQIGLSELLIEQFICQVDFCARCLTIYSCNRCEVNYFLQNNNCVTQCSAGYYQTLSLQLCSVACPSNYYPILQDYSCSACISPCLSCLDSLNCLSCISGYYLFNFTCDLLCPSTYFENGQTNSCDPCQYPCKDCNADFKNCLSCRIGYLDTLNHKCVFTCPIGYFSNFTIMECTPCSILCLECTFTAEKCTKCSSPYFLNPNSTCLQKCDDTFSQNQASRICLKCSYPCRTCGSEINSCSSCYFGYLLNETCLQQCPPPYFNNQFNKTCSFCPAACQSCVSVYFCTSCTNLSFFYQSKGLCLNSCPNGTYSRNNQCYECVSPCLDCLNQTHCTSCVGSLFSFYEGRCYLACPLKTFSSIEINSSIKICNRCGINCLTCFNEQHCTKCQSNSLYNSICVNKCQSMTYLSIDNECLSCVFPCQQCLSTDICITCQLGYFYHQDSFSCLQVCPLGFYQSNFICKICSPSCLTCFGTFDNCIQCNRQYYQISNSSCVSECPPGTYAFNQINICRLCSAKCKTCQSQSICTSCHQNSLYSYQFYFDCQSSCPAQFYANLDLICKKCSPNCLTCSNLTNCSSCNPSLNLFWNAQASIYTCVLECPLQFFVNSFAICTGCYFPCLACSSENYCLSCAATNVNLLNGKCYDICPMGYYSTIQKVCKKCELFCLSCRSIDSNCSSCLINYFLLKSNDSLWTCVSKCPSTTYSNNINQQCVSCIFPCRQCHNKNYCKSCVPGYYLQSNLCVLSCLTTYFVESTTNICIKCVSPCINCLDQHRCLSCLVGVYNSVTSLCEQNCLENQYVYQNANGGGICLSCPIDCSSCYDYTACKSCYANSSKPYLQGTNCKNNCTSGYFESSTQSFFCESCGWGCLHCTSINNCASCIASFLFKGKCMKECPIGFYESTAFICEPCVSPCVQCIDSFNCQYCSDGYYLYLSTCLSSCPTNQWAIPQINLCVESCPASYYMNLIDRTCVSSCAHYHNQRGQCIDNCPQNMLANQTLGCENCINIDCSNQFLYQLAQQQIQGKLVILLITNFPIDNQTEYYTNFAVIKTKSNLNISSQQLKLSFLRNLISSASQFSWSINSIDSPYIIQFHLSLNDPLDVFSGSITLEINDLTALSSNNYPFQIYTSSVHIDWFHRFENDSFQVAYFAYVLSVIILLLLVINLLFDNIRAAIIPIDGLQNLHILAYLNVWYHPYVETFLKNIRFISLRSSILNLDKSSSIWNCPPKYIFSYGLCSLYNQTILPFSIILLITIIIAFCRFSQCIKKKYNIFWNQIYSTYWIVSLTLGVSAFTYLFAYRSLIEFIFSMVLVFLFVGATLVISYQIIKNVYDCSFSQKSFFWGLKKHNGNSISCLHPFFIMLRRLIIAIAIGVAADTSLSCIFIITLLTIFIICNIIINSPFKIHQIAIILSQISFCTILVLLQMYIVNAAKIENQTWNIYGIILFVLMLIYTALLSFILIQQTYKCLKKYLNKKQNLQEQGLAIKEVSSNSTNEKQITSGKFHQKEQEKQVYSNIFGRVMEESNQTEQQLIRHHDLQLVDEKQPSHDYIFSDSGTILSDSNANQKSSADFTAPKFLIKISKKVKQGNDSSQIQENERNENNQKNDMN